MKKFNKIFAATTASLLCLSSMTALSGNAVFWTGIPNNEEQALEMIKDRLFYNSVESFIPDTSGMFSNDDRIVYFTDNRGLCMIETYPETMEFTLNSASSITEGDEKIILDFLNELYPDVYFEVKTTSPSSFSIYDHDALPFDGRLDTANDAEVVYNFVAENFSVESCEFYGGYIIPQRGGMGGYMCTNNEKYISEYDYCSPDTIDILKNYIVEKGLDVELNTSNPRGEDPYPCALTPTREMTLQETVQIYTDIYNDLGLKPRSYYQESMTSVAAPLNLCKTDGDANTDGVLGIADATLILQYLTNKNEYDLTEQGAYNADLDKDGITANDALVIQQMLAERGEV